MSIRIAKHAALLTAHCAAVLLAAMALAWGIRSEAALAAPQDRWDEMPQIGSDADPAADVAPLHTELSQSQRDRSEALIQFSVARTLQREDEHGRALGHYERAMRYDPGSVVIAEALLEIAARLDRQDEGVRHLLRMTCTDQLQPVLIRKFAAHAAEKLQLHDAIALYGRAIRALGTADDPMHVLALLLEMERGRLQAVAGRKVEAARSLRPVFEAIQEPQQHGLNQAMRLALIGNSGSTARLMAECFFAADEMKMAADAYRMAAEDATDEALRLFDLARAARADGDPSSSLSLLEQAIDRGLSDQGTEPFDLAADLWSASGREQTLADWLLARRERLGGQAAWAVATADALVDQDRFDQAVGVLRETLAERPSARAYEMLLQILVRQQDAPAIVDLAAEVFRQTLSLDVLGEGLATLKEDDDLIRSVLEQVRRPKSDRSTDSEPDAAPEQDVAPANDPREGDGGKGGTDDRDASQWARSMVAAVIALETDRLDTADALFDKTITVLEDDPDRAVQVLVAWTSANLAKERVEIADRLLPIARTLHAGDAGTDGFSLFLAHLEMLAGNLAEAKELVAKARQHERLRPEALTKEIWMHIRAEEYDKAWAAYEVFIDEYGDQYGQPALREAVRDAHMLGSLVAGHRDDPQAAIESLQAVLDEFPDDTGAMNDLGYLWADRGENLPRALAMIEEAVADQPDNAAYRDSLGWVLFRLGRYDEAIRELEKAVATESSTEIVEHLATAYETVGREADARALRAEHALDDGAAEPEPIDGTDDASAVVK